MANEKNDDMVTDVVQTTQKKKPRGKNIGETLAPVTEPGDNAKYINVSMKLFNLPRIDLRDPEQVVERLSEYFQIHFDADLKPTVAGMAMALGVDRRRLWEIRTDTPTSNRWVEDLPTLTKDSIKRAYDFMENMWECYMLNGKINPVSGIFLGKNNFGYQDKQEMVVTPNVNNDSDYNADDIRARYLSDSSTLPTLDSPDSGDS